MESLVICLAVRSVSSDQWGICIRILSWATILLTAHVASPVSPVSALNVLHNTRNLTTPKNQKDT